MPARKPAGLNRRHDTKADQAARDDAEQSLTPERPLPMEPPARLAGHDAARATWRALLREFAAVEQPWATRLDMELLVNYCLLVEQAGELDVMRRKAYEVWLQLSAAHGELTKAGLLEDAVAMALEVVGAFDAVVKLDARVDRKRALIHQVQQSLYLTPRARAGATPARRGDDDEPRDPLEALLDDVNLDGDEKPGR